MPSPALKLKPPTWAACGGFISLFFELVLVGIPGPCAFSGVLDSFLHRWIGFEVWLAYLWIVASLLTILLGAAWFAAAIFVRWLNRPHPPAAVDPPTPNA